ncbi:MAG: AAA family ATPase, partial [Dehalococcoidia bacterium]
ASDVTEALAGVLLSAGPSERTPGGRPPAPNTGGASIRGDDSTSGGDRPPSIGGQGAQGAENPIYQRAFVGREAELRQLEGAFDAAVSGQGGLVMVVGEPGIGKTTLTEQLATYAGLRGGRVLVGHCYEEGSLSLPYLPFVEALRSYVLARDDAALKQDLGSAAGDVARIVSEVRDRVQIVPAPASADPGEDRYRLLSAVTGFLKNAGAVQPLVLVLEDLHDADRGTLELLTFVARQLAGARLLVVGTYRDVEVDRAHPLSATLAELQRGGSFARLRLRGLTADEVQRMLSAITGQAVRWGLAEAVHRQTEGNPLFVQEVIRYLVEEGLLTREGGRWRAAGQTPLLERIPEGLRDVIGKRLSRLSEPCNRLLAVAAVIGRDFQLATLVAVTGDGQGAPVGTQGRPSETSPGAPVGTQGRPSETSDDRVSELLDEAVKVAVLQEQAKVGALHYRFAHAFFRQTLYDELSAARRLRLHQQVAKALEQQYAVRVEEHAAELAEHYAQSTNAADLAKAVHYGQVAAQRASAVYAHGEAMRLLSQALDVQEVLDPDDSDTLCTLLIALAEAMLYAGDLRLLVDSIAPRALRLAEALADPDRAGRACYLALHALLRFGGAVQVGTPELAAWAERLDRVAQPNTIYRAWADAWQAMVLLWRGGWAEAWTLRKSALALAHELHDPETLAFASAAFIFVGGRPLEREERLAVAYEAAPMTEHMSTAGARLLCQHLIPNFGTEGDFEAAEAQISRQQQYAERTGDEREGLFVLNTQARLAAYDGRLEEALVASDRLAEQAEALGVSGYGNMTATMIRRWPLVLLGRAEEALQEQTLQRQLPGIGWSRLAVEGATRALLLAQAGRREEAEAQFAPFAAAQREAGHEWNEIQLKHMLATAVMLGDVEVARGAATELAVGGDYGSALLYGPYTGCVARYLGELAVLQGDRDEAKRRYTQALAVAAHNRIRPETALTRLQLAELLAGPLAPNAGGTFTEADGDERDLAEAREHLAFCIPEFEAMKMAPSLERARALQAQLGAPSGAASSATGQVFISYSSEERLPAERLAETLKAHAISSWLDKRNIPAGSSWDAAIVKGIRACAVVAVLCSPKAMASDHVRQELRLALQYRKPILPLLLEPTPFPEEVEYVLAGRQWIELVGRSEEAGFADVLAAVQRLV